MNKLFAYGNSVSQLNVDAINSSIPAAKGLVEVANSIQNNIGGLTSLFTGDNDLKTFGSTLCTFGLGLKDYANAVTELNVDAISNSIPAAKALAELTNVIPQNGGLLSIFTGNNDLSYFGSQLSSFGFAMNSYADSISGFDESSLASMDAVAEATSKLAGISSSLPQLGGLFGLFTGEQNLATFGVQLSAFGGSIKAYADSVSGIDEDSATSIGMSVDAASNLAGLYDRIPQLGGLASIFSGDQNLIVFGKQLVPFGKALKEYGDVVTDLTIDDINNSVNAINVLSGIYDNLPKLGGLISIFSGEQNLISFGNQLVPFGKSLKDYGDSVTGLVNEDIQNSTTAAKELVSVIESINGLSTSNVGSFVTAINTLGTTQVENFVSAFSDKSAASKLQTACANLISSLEKGIKSKSESIKSSMTSVLNALINDVKDKADKFKSPGEKVVVKMTSGIKGKKDKISKTLVSAIKSALKDVKSYYTDFYTAGTYLISGFAAGISANSYKAEAKARQMAKNAYKAAKDELDINSPSKVFRRLGAAVPEGFAQGIERFSRFSNRSSLSMAQTAVETARTALSRMTDVLSSDMSNAPTITPVLDLSNVQSGMGTLGTMLNSANSIGLTANLNAIGTMRAARRQNGTNGDVVTAIKKLGKDIGNMDRNSYNINGITYDQGSDVADAVETLVRAIRIDRRS